MTKVALCLHGIAKGQNYKHGGLEVGFEREAELYSKNYIMPNHADVFVHSWSGEYQSQIDAVYKPVLSSYEASRSFVSPSFKDHLIDLQNRLTGRPRELNRLNNIYSRWYSLYRVIELLRSHEQKNKFAYDFVMVSRFDMSLLSTVDFMSMEKDKFYVADWLGYRSSGGAILAEGEIFSSQDKAFEFKRGFPHDDEGLLDFWFISSSKVMSVFSQIFLELESLVSKVGMSNHKIALRKIMEMNALGDIRPKYRAFEDFCLTRWM